MKILFLDAYFEPEQIAFTHLEHDLLQGLVDDGHEVEIVCPTPTRGISIEEAQKYKWIRSETIYDGHVQVTRFSAPVERKNPIIRALRYFWCNLRTYQIGKKAKNVDVVFANSTPPTQGLIAGKVAKKHKVPFIYSLQDIFPDSLITTGFTKHGSFLWKIGREIENATYKRCSRIIVISNNMKDNLLRKGVRKEKIEVISNWIDLDKIRPISKEDNLLFDEFGINRGKFIVLYAGNFGAAQGAEIVLDVAEALLVDESIFFVIFGGGSGYNAAEEKACRLSNVFIHPLLPQEKVSNVYSMGDVNLITCKKGVGNSGMPSKTWSIMACNSPIIASFDTDSELSNVLSEAKAGFIVEPGNIESIKSKIIEISKNKESNNINSRDYVMKNASRPICVKQYIKMFSLLANKNN